MNLNQFKRKHAHTHTKINTILILVIFSNILNGTIINYSTIFFENPQNQSNGENLGGFCNESITLDGFLNESSWSRSYNMNFTLNIIHSGEVYNVTLILQNNNSHLFIGVILIGDYCNDSDLFYFCFDSNNNGEVYETNEDHKLIPCKLVVNLDYYWNDTFAWRVPDSIGGGTSEVLFMYRNDTINDEYYTYLEMQFPLKTGHYTDIQLEYGKEYGLVFGYEDGDYGGGYKYRGWNPFNPSLLDWTIPFKIFSEFGINDKPIINSPSDRSILLNSFGEEIEWEIIDNSINDSFYEIYQNDDLLITENWTQGDLINISLVGLTEGLYNYTIIFYDGLGLNVRDTVFVNVAWNFPPTITHPADISFKINSTGKNITWSVTDINQTAAFYKIYQNGDEILSGNWVSGDDIILDLSGLKLSNGTYEFKIRVDDGFGLIAEDIVNVVVSLEEEKPTETSTTTDTISTNSTDIDNTDLSISQTPWIIMIYSSGAVLSLIIIIQNKKKKHLIRE